jgi:peptide/nickel transport system permease protein
MATTLTAGRLARWGAESRGLRFARQVLETRLVGTGLTISAIVILCAIFADLISPHDPNFQDYAALTEPPSAAHWLGTDDIGRDVLARIIHGTRVSLQVGRSGSRSVSCPATSAGGSTT